MKRLSDKKFEAIFNEYKNLVYFIVSKYVDDAFDKEDLTNEVFVKFFERHESVKNVKYFLATVAKNTAIDFVRKKKNLVVPLEDAAEVVYVDEGYQSGYRDAINNMKKALNDLEINVLLSHAVFCDTFKEIAARYEKSLDTVYYTYKNAVKKYKKFKEGRSDE